MEEAVSLEVALKAVLPHASKLPTLPPLRGVSLCDGYAIATDRYTVARARISHTFEGQRFLSSLMVRSLLSMKSPVVTLSNKGVTLENGARLPWGQEGMDHAKLMGMFDKFKPGHLDKLSVN